MVQSDGAVPVIMNFPSAADENTPEEEMKKSVARNLPYMAHFTAIGLVQALKTHNQALLDLANEMDLFILNMDKEFPHDPELFAGDLIHCNDKGCALLAQKIAQIMIQGGWLETN